jgi:phospholipase/lecithinase/hemolysin
MSVHRFAVALLAALSFSPAVWAASYSAVVVYGDSLSDNGNLYAATIAANLPLFPPSPPYFSGRLSNGPVAVEQVATRLNKPLLDFAWIGATTGQGNLADGGTVTQTGTRFVPGMNSAYAQTIANFTPYVADGLFIVWGGPNDLEAPSSLDNGVASAIITRAVQNEVAIITDMHSRGVNTILAPGMPDLGLTPKYAANAVLATAFSDGFNLALQSALAALSFPVLTFDTTALMRSIVANPSDYGFTNVTAPCFNGLTVCANPNSYLFYDSFHPTTAADTIIARGFLAAAGVPEPSTLALFGVGMALFMMRRRGRVPLKVRVAAR